MKNLVPGTVAGIVAATLLAAPALAGPTVTVRVEGASSTLLERTRVTLPDSPPPVAGCDKWTVAAAIEAATNGNWDRDPYTKIILGESHAFTQNDYWAEWVDRGGGYRSGAGVCADVLKDGDEALMYATTFAQPATHFPLDLEGLPAAVEVGKPVTVTVVAYASPTGDIGSGTRTPVEGATVSGGGVSAVTGPDGTATIAFPQTGAVVAKASKPGSVVSAGERLTVSATPVAPNAGGGTPRADDKTAPVAALSGLKNGAKFSRKRAPRTLRGTVSADPSGLKSVRLSIVRRHKGRCWAFDGESERFQAHRCGGSRSFRIGDRATWSYLLPKRLPAGRYTIRVAAIDNAGNASATETEIRVK